MTIEKAMDDWLKQQLKRVNDRLRQEVLEGKGWNFFRIWSTDWFRDPISELDQLDKLIKKLSSSNR